MSDFNQIESIKKKVDRILESNREIKLELGAGNKPGRNGWVTLDQNDICDIGWDLNKGIPFPNESVSMIYTSHLLEHFYFKQMQQLLKECLKVLKPGGIISVCVPCARLFIEAYLNKDLDFWKNLPRHFMPAWDNTSTMMDIVNYMAYMDGHHKYMFDEENLTRVFEIVGFSLVSLRDFDPSLDNPDRKPVSIYAYARK